MIKRGIQVSRAGLLLRLYGHPYIFSAATAQEIPKNYFLTCAYNFDGVLSQTRRSDEYVRQRSSDDGHYCGHEYYYGGASNGGDADAHRQLYTLLRWVLQYHNDAIDDHGYCYELVHIQHFRPRNGFR